MQNKLQKSSRWFSICLVFFFTSFFFCFMAQVEIYSQKFLSGFCIWNLMQQESFNELFCCFCNIKYVQIFVGETLYLACADTTPPLWAMNHLPSSSSSSSSGCQQSVSCRMMLLFQAWIILNERMILRSSLCFFFIYLLFIWVNTVFWPRWLVVLLHSELSRSFFFFCLCLFIAPDMDFSCLYIT